MKFLVDYHGNGDPNDPLVVFEFNEIREAISQERAAKAERWSQILKKRSNLHRLALAALMIFLTNVRPQLLSAFSILMLLQMSGCELD